MTTFLGLCRDDSDCRVYSLFTFFRCCGIIQSWPRRYQVLPDAPELRDVPCHSLELPNDNVPARASLRVIASVKPYDLPPVSIQSIWVQLHLFNQLFLCSFHFHCFFPRTTCHWKLLEERNYHFLTSFFLAFECEWEMRSSNKRQSIIIWGVLLLGIALQSSALLYNFFATNTKICFSVLKQENEFWHLLFWLMCLPVLWKQGKTTR